MKDNKKRKEKIEAEIHYVIMTQGCVWCGKQIRDDEWMEHPRHCIYYQEYLKQIV